MKSVSDSENNIWRDGNMLVLAIANPCAPSRCLISNRPVFRFRRYKKIHGWADSHSSVPFLPIYVKVLVGLAVMKFVTIEVAISDEEQAKRNMNMLASATVFLLAVALLTKGILLGLPPHFEYMLPGVILGIGAITVFMNKFSILHVVRMDSRHIWLLGAGPAFLDSLPDYRASLAHGSAQVVPKTIK